MPTMPHVLRSASATQVRLALRYSGLFILTIGCVAAFMIWAANHNPRDGIDERINNPNGPLAATDSRKASRDIEMYYGKTGLLMERWREDLGSLGHGKRLAILILVGVALTSAGCFLVAERL